MRRTARGYILSGGKENCVADLGNAAAKLGRAGGKATAAKRTPKERSEAARAAVLARWEKYRKLHPAKTGSKAKP